MDIKELFVFDLIGTFAHFRKYYTNSSSLSYTFPPRTVITGIIAAALGMDRDSYYSEFSVDKCKLAVSVLSPVKKSIHTVNYLYVKNLGELTGKSGHTQVPVEIVFPKKGSEIRYRVYFYHREEAIVKALKQRIERPIYPIYFGISEFIAKGEKVGDASVEELVSDLPVSVNSVLNLDFTQENGLVLREKEKVLRYISEVMPLEFDTHRRLVKKAKFVYEVSHEPVIAKLKVPYYRVSYLGKTDNILFMS